MWVHAAQGNPKGLEDHPRGSVMGAVGLEVNTPWKRVRITFGGMVKGKRLPARVP